MTTYDYLSRELRRARISLHRAEKKPNTPDSEMQGLRDKTACLEKALAAVQGRDLARPRLDRDAWEPCEHCITCRTCRHVLNSIVNEPCLSCKSYSNHDPEPFCSRCGRPLTDAAWAELERRVQG